MEYARLQTNVRIDPIFNLRLLITLNMIYFLFIFHMLYSVGIKYVV